MKCDRCGNVVNITLTKVEDRYYCASCAENVRNTASQKVTYKDEVKK